LYFLVGSDGVLVCLSDLARYCGVWVVGNSDYKGTNNRNKRNWGFGSFRRWLRAMVPLIESMEHRSSVLCCCCHGRVRQARKRVRKSDGTWIWTSIHGAVTCPDPRCPLFGRTIARDLNAGTTYQSLGLSVSFLRLTFSLCVFAQTSDQHRLHRVDHPDVNRPPTPPAFRRSTVANNAGAQRPDSASSSSSTLVDLGDRNPTSS